MPFCADLYTQKEPKKGRSLNLHQQDGGDYLVHNIKYDNTNFAKNLKGLVKKSNITQWARLANLVRY